MNHPASTSVRREVTFRSMRDALNATMSANPLQHGGFLKGLFILMERTEIKDLRDLVAVDDILQLMYDPEFRATSAWENLRAKAERYIARYSDLLEVGWLRAEGCIHQLMEEMRFNTSDAQRALVKFRLPPKSS